MLVLFWFHCCVAGLGPDPHFLPADLPMPPSSSTPEPLPPMSAHDHFGVPRSMGMTPFSQSLPSSGPHHHPPELTSSEVWWRLAMEQQQQQQQQQQLFQLKQDDWKGEVWRHPPASNVAWWHGWVSEQGSRLRSFCETERVEWNVQPPLSAEGLLERRACLTNTCLHTFLERLATPQSGNSTFNGHLMSQVEQKVPWLCVDCETGQPMATLRLLAVCYPRSNRKSRVFVLTGTRGQ